jgi:hypothetical protein
MITIFGTFTSAAALGRVLDKWLAGICVGLGLFGYLRGFLACLPQRRIKDEVEVPDKEKL